MKVLSIKQPWASLIMLGYKRFEFRSWKTNYRGKILIHASKGEDKEAAIRLKKYVPDKLPKGVILGQAEIVDCIKCDEKFKTMCQKENKEIYAKSNFAEDYAWQLKDIKEFKDKIEVKGNLGLWNYDM